MRRNRLQSKFRQTEIVKLNRGPIIPGPDIHMDCETSADSEAVASRCTASGRSNSAADPPSSTSTCRILAFVGSVTASSVLRTFEAGHHRGSTTGNSTGVIVEDGDDVSPGKDHSEFEGELWGSSAAVISLFSAAAWAS